MDSEKETTKHEETKKILLAPRAHFLFFSKLEFLASVGLFSQQHEYTNITNSVPRIALASPFRAKIKRKPFKTARFSLPFIPPSHIEILLSYICSLSSLKLLRNRQGSK